MNAPWRRRLVESRRPAVSRRQLMGGISLSAVASLFVQGTGESKKNRRKKRRRRRRHNRADLTVMTRNLYLGADLGPLFVVTSPQELVATGTALFATVKQTDFPARARLLAAEIKEAEPTLIGLQEVSLWRTQTPSDGSTTPNAQTVVYDFLATLLDELSKLGLSYAAVATVTNFDGEVPIMGDAGLVDLRLTDRDVILARNDLPSSKFSVANARSGNYTATLTIPNPILGDVKVLRGWTSIDVTRKGIQARVVNTHLDASSPQIQVAQGQELLAGPLNSTLPTILIGDNNSDALGAGTPGVTDTPTYKNFLAAGFVDAWPSDRGKQDSVTCCQPETLQNAQSSLTERIDIVLTRGTVTASDATRVGADPQVRTPSGLWPSDHAGLSATLRLKRSG